METNTTREAKSQSAPQPVVQQVYLSAQPIESDEWPRSIAARVTTPNMVQLEESRRRNSIMF